MRAFGLNTWIWNNGWKTGLLLAGFPFLLLLISFAFGLLVVAEEAHSFRAGLHDAARIIPAVLPAVLAVTAIWFAIAWFWNQRILDLLSGAHPVTRKEEPRLWNMVETLCISRGLGMPRLAVIEQPARNAFASGLSRQTGAVTVTRGLLEALDDRELAAVLAHELTHIRNGDARLAVVAAVFAGVVSLPGELLVRTGRAFGNGGYSFGSGRSSSRSSSKDDNKGGGAAILLVLLALAIMLLTWALALALRFALSRNREFLADAGAVELTQDPDALITALRKVATRAELPRLPSQIQAMLLESPGETMGRRWLATHPPLEERIAALVRYAGGRDPGPVSVLEPAAPAEAPQPVAPPPPGSPWWRQG
ncbi:M48 family metalloprotease [Belnapia sp. T6]|uniref:M48 family metalloprotease n=1 Tax=Belnapia mucosa TaxID=2804532 RepID=A0ABS1V9K8_9PROT|nr:M48 family metalloprotease [Belnapia mucosa]MBL6458357.1 M48 family metalloprotease [Belnapia mucosa]